MNLFAKVLSIIVGLIGTAAFLLVLISDGGFVSVGRILLVLLVLGILVSVILGVLILKPVHELMQALVDINFESEVIDLSKVKDIKEYGFYEVVTCIHKFKYLMDILSERIIRYNNEQFKSEHDELTGLYNRLRLERNKEFYESCDNIFVIFIDVNNLKRMNDENGHEAGDCLLKTAASKLSFWESYGDVYRMGGDEFMVVLTNKTDSYCMYLIDIWYPRVGVLNRVTDGFKCVLSYGVSSGEKGCDFDIIMGQADEEMYTMKVALKKEFGEELR